MRNAILLLLFVTLASSVNAQELGWAPGLSVFANPIGPRETTAEVENGIVQTTSIQSSAVLPAVEAHTFYNCGLCECGPFAAITLGDGLVNQVHGGVMFGLQRFNLGIGYSLKPGGQVLRGDFVPGQPAPSDDVKYVTRSVTGISIVLGIPLP